MCDSQICGKCYNRCFPFPFSSSIQPSFQIQWIQRGRSLLSANQTQRCARQEPIGEESTRDQGLMWSVETAWYTTASACENNAANPPIRSWVRDIKPLTWLIAEFWKISVFPVYWTTSDDTFVVILYYIRLHTLYCFYFLFFKHSFFKVKKTLLLKTKCNIILQTGLID